MKTTNELLINASNLSVDVKGKKTILQSQELEVYRGDFIGVLGPSGCGKSTLMEAVYGITPPALKVDGNVSLLGQKITREGKFDQNKFSRIKRLIGYVPQYEILHEYLTVDEALRISSKIKQDKVSDDLYEKKRDKILKELSLIKKDESDKRGFLNKLIKELSGGQKKRVNIAGELLTDPKILFLDEPTSPLDPSTIKDFLEYLKSLCENKGIAIIMVTHKPSDLNYVNKVLFLGKSGYQCFFGKQGEMPSHFSDEDILKPKPFNIEDVIEWYPKVNDNERAKAYYHKQYANFYKKEKLSNTNFEEDENEFYNDSPKESSFSQFLWLTGRNLSIKKNNLSAFIKLIVTPLVISLFIGLIFDRLGLNVFLLIVISSIWMGTFNAAKEFVEERKIFKRESRFNLKTLPYYFSKLFVQSLMALIQTIIFTCILYLFYEGFYKDAKVDINFINYFNIIFILMLSGSILGLFLSAWRESTEMVLLFLPMFLIPQIILSGVIQKLDNKLTNYSSYTQVARWGVENFTYTTKELRFDKLAPNETFLCASNQKPCAVFDENKPIEEEKLVNSFEMLNTKSFISDNVENTKTRSTLNFIMIFFINFILFLLSIYFLNKTANE